MPRALILLNGKPPRRALLRSLARNADVIVAADAGAHELVKAKIPFRAVVGDLDSLDQKLLRRETQIIHNPGQDDTDFEKTLRWVLDNTEAREIVFTGGISEELDHVLTNMSVAAKFANKARISEVEDNLTVYFVADSFTLHTNPGAKVSLIPLGKAEGITTQGLHWALANETLEMGRREGLHNVATKNKVSVALRKGCLAVMVPRENP